eukprot:5998010-Prymnesium_polylepis.1
MLPRSAHAGASSCNWSSTRWIQEASRSAGPCGNSSRTKRSSGRSIVQRTHGDATAMRIARVTGRLARGGKVE